MYGTPKILIYDATTLALNRVLPQEGKGWSGCLAWSPKGNRLAVGYSNGALSLLDVDGSNALDLEGHQGLISALAWSPDGNWLASGAEDKTIRLWDTKSTTGAALTGHQDSVLALAWSPDGKRLASADATGAVRLWRSDGKPINVFTGPPASPLRNTWGIDVGFATPLAWRPDGQRLALRGLANALRIVDPDGQPGPILQGHEDDILAVVWSPDGKRLASAGRDKTVRLWSADGSAAESSKAMKPT